MGHILIDKGRCKGCARCIVACPKGLIEMSADLNEKGYRVWRAAVAPPLLAAESGYETAQE